MSFHNQVINQVEADINRKIANDRLKHHLRESSQTDSAPPPRRSFHPGAAFTRLFPQRERVQAPAPDTKSQS